MGTRDRKKPDLSARPGYITVEGYQRLADEADRLWNVKRPAVTQALAEAAAEGDRSENAEYIYRKRQLAEIDRSLRFLRKRLDVLTIVREKPKNDGKIYFGSYVSLESEAGEIFRYRIVGPDEWEFIPNGISMDSPMGRVLIGKSVDDEVLVRRPKGETLFTIIAVSADKNG